MYGYPNQPIKEILGEDQNLSQAYPIIADYIGKLFEFLRVKVFSPNRVSVMNFFIDFEE
jgi:hypothetical protein